MLLCAGITSLSFNYSNLIIVIVTKLKQRSQSAGNFIYFCVKLWLATNFKDKTTLRTVSLNHVKNYINLSNAGYNYIKKTNIYNLAQISKVLFRALAGSTHKNIKNTSETLRNKTLTNIKKVSIHVPTHAKPQSTQDFGHYLAGLIDGKGTFSNYTDHKGNKTLQLVISFNLLNASLAYYIKGQIGYGKVVKNKNEIILVIDKAQGLAKVIDLINGKIRSVRVLDQIKFIFLYLPFRDVYVYQSQINSDFYSSKISNSSIILESAANFVANTGSAIKKNANNLTGAKRVIKINQLTKFKLNDNQELSNHWLAGFADLTSVFQIKIKDLPIEKLNDNLPLANNMNLCAPVGPVESETQRRERECKTTSLTVICLAESKTSLSKKDHKLKSEFSSENEDWLIRDVQLNLQIEHNKEDLLNLIKRFLGGNIGYNKNKNTYYYTSDSFGSAKKIIEYLDRYHLLSSNHVNYLKWRKAYVIIQDKEDLNKFAVDKIIKLRNSMNKYYNDKNV